MATTYTANLDFISKEVFPEGDPYWNMVDQATPALDLIESTPEIPFHGKPQGNDGYHFPVRTKGGSNSAVPVATGQRNVGLPVSQNQTGDKLVHNIKSMYQAMELEEDVFDNLTGGEESTMDGFTFEMENQQADARKMMSWYLHRNGSGKLASITSASLSSASTATVDDNLQLQNGRQFVIRDLNGGTLASGQTGGTALQVSADPSGTTDVTWTDENGNSTPITEATATDFGIYAYDTQGKAIQGFEAMVADADFTDYGVASATYGGVSVTGNPWHTGYRHDAGGDMISIQDDIQPFLDAVKRRATHLLSPLKRGNAVGTKMFAFTGYQNFRAIGNALKADQRTSANYTTLEGGYEAIDYEGVMFVIDDDAPASRIRFICPDKVRRFVVKPWFWQDREGSIWRRQLANDGRDSEIFKAYMYTRQNFITIYRLCHGEIYNTNATS